MGILSPEEAPAPIFDVDVQAMTDDQIERLLASSDLPFNLRRRLRAERADRVEAELEEQQRQKRLEEQRAEERERQRERERRAAELGRADEWARLVAERAPDLLDDAAEGVDIWRREAGIRAGIPHPFEFDVSPPLAAQAAAQLIEDRQADRELQARQPQPRLLDAPLTRLLGAVRGEQRAVADGGTVQRVTASGAIDVSLLEVLVALALVALVLSR